jgi:hypothetical protein
VPPGGAASRHTSFACFFTISTPFSHLAPTRRQRPHLLAAGVAIATGYREVKNITFLILMIKYLILLRFKEDIFCDYGHESP